MNTSRLGINNGIQESEKEEYASKSFHKVIPFLITTMGLLLQVKYQSVETSPFDTHYTAMVCSIVAVFIYAVSFAAEAVPFVVLNSSYRTVFWKISVFSGSLVPILLLQIIVAALGWFFLIVWGIFFIGTISYACKQLFYSCLDSFHKAFLYVFRTLISYNPMPQPRRLPV